MTCVHWDNLSMPSVDWDAILSSSSSQHASLILLLILGWACVAFPKLNFIIIDSFLLHIPTTYLPFSSLFHSPSPPPSPPFPLQPCCCAGLNPTALSPLPNLCIPPTLRWDFTSSPYFLCQAGGMLWRGGLGMAWWHFGILVFLVAWAF